MGGYRRFSWTAPAVGLALLAGLLAGCPKKPAPPAAPAAVTIGDAASLIAEVRRRGEALSQLDGSLEIRVEDTPSPYRGRFYGTVRMERRGPDELGLAIQTYSLIGVPVLELIAVGGRLEIFLPLERTVLVNSKALLAGARAEEFPLSSFSDMVLPLNLITGQLPLIWGMGFAERYRLELSETPLAYVLREFDGVELRREISYLKSGLRFQQARIYQGGITTGGLVCEDYPDNEGNSVLSLVPQRIVLYQGYAKASFSLSKVRVNDAVTGPAIAFRAPAPEQRLILLTPPAP